MLCEPLNSTQQDITDVGADTSYVRIYMSNLIKKHDKYHYHTTIYKYNTHTIHLLLSKQNF